MVHEQSDGRRVRFNSTGYVKGNNRLRTEKGHVSAKVVEGWDFVLIKFACGSQHLEFGLLNFTGVSLDSSLGFGKQSAHGSRDRKTRTSLFLCFEKSSESPMNITIDFFFIPCISYLPLCGK